MLKRDKVVLALVAELDGPVAGVFQGSLKRRPGIKVVPPMRVGPPAS